jgi:hypothetical protein
VTVAPRWIALIVALAAAAMLMPAAAQAADRAAAARGAAWLVRGVPPGTDGGTAADALVAMRAAGRLPRGEAARRAAALRRTARGYAQTAGATGKVVLGLAAAGANPRCATGVDLLGRLRGLYRRGRYGTTSYDQAYAMLAMRALRSRPPSSAVRFLLGARDGGGWSFSLSRARRDDVSSTALAIMALRAAGVPRSNGNLRSALRWIRSQRTPAGGFAEGRRDRNEANSTARAIQAAVAMGSRDSRAERALVSLQRGGGEFQFTRNDAGSRALATNDAVPALAGRAFPVAVAGRTPGRC